MGAASVQVWPNPLTASRGIGQKNARRRRKFLSFSAPAGALDALGGSSERPAKTRALGGLALVQGALVDDGAADDLLDGPQADEGAVFDLLVVLRDVVLLGHDVHGLRGHHLG